jgi:hypothetical protein
MEVWLGGSETCRKVEEALEEGEAHTHTHTCVEGFDLRDKVNDTSRVFGIPLFQHMELVRPANRIV